MNPRASGKSPILRPPSWAAPLLVGAATCLAFAPVLGNGFVRWDDRTMLLAQDHYRGLGLSRLRWMWTTVYFCGYQPLTWLSYALDYELWGLNPFGFHLSNILVHAANSVLFYFLSLRLLDGGGAEGPAAAPAAVFSALVFSVHPLRVESVAWAAERKDVLAAFFFLAALMAYLRAADAPKETARAWRRSAFASALCSLLCKPMAVTLPGVFILLDLYPLGRLPAELRGWLSPSVRGVLREKLPYVLLSIGAGLVALGAQSGCAAVLPLDYFGLRPRLAQAAFGVVFYLWKTAAPFGLSPLYDPSSLLDPAPFVAAALLAAGATLALLLLRRRFPWALAAWAYYVIVLFPVLGLIKLGRQAAADRYSYFSCLPWALLAGASLRGLLSSRRGAALKALALAAGAALLLALAALTRRQALAWRSEAGLWTQAVRVAPDDYMPHRLLSSALGELGLAEQARRELALARRLQADYCCRVGVRLMRRGRLADALVLLRQALEVLPGHEPALKAIEELRRRQQAMGGSGSSSFPKSY